MVRASVPECLPGELLYPLSIESKEREGALQLSLRSVVRAMANACSGSRDSPQGGCSYRTAPSCLSCFMFEHSDSHRPPFQPMPYHESPGCKHAADPARSAATMCEHNPQSPDVTRGSAKQRSESVLTSAAG